MPKKRNAIAATVGLLAAAGATVAVTSAAQATEPPPDGARAVVHVTPNPTTERGQEIEITGHCGGGEELRAVIGGFPERPILTDVEILDPDPAAFRARARLAEGIGNGVGPVFVDCGTQLGVTLLVTHV